MPTHISSAEYGDRHAFDVFDIPDDELSAHIRGCYEAYGRPVEISVHPGEVDDSTLVRMVWTLDTDGSHHFDSLWF